MNDETDFNSFGECVICGNAMDEQEWDDRHELHDEGCDGDGCDCDYPCHAACCPCQTGKPYPGLAVHETEEE